MLCECSPEALEALKGAIVVMPAVTYANVGELAVDVLVETLTPQPLGSLESVNLLSVVGNDAFDPDPSVSPPQPGRLTTALELFRVPGRPLAFLQQRAPAMLGRQAAFAAELVGWLVEAGAAGLVLLTGLDAQLRKDRQLDSSQLRFLASSEELRDACAAAQLTPPLLEQQLASSPLQQSSVVLELEPEIKAEELQLHHSLPPWPLVQQCEARGLSYVLLGCFSAEGDNAGEGMRLAAAALQVLAAIRAPAATAAAEALGAEGGLLGLAANVALPLRAPPSWAGLYGRSFPLEIF
ncbi:hypothetical protein Vretimale_2018 [Volvox reticuliferus]|uniref:Proteasome assembly chaperone 2 n=1 Tax=Volvox reticuliferus TaxID=1737510 RepID=A0A8J4C910_9CHLO|nr:hypothetical protein Vretifemale_4331 [Volvox reticuliferus]GIL96135.1 hypothetical protein Vretimale_2018 [Volvox reticuliferus]